MHAYSDIGRLAVRFCAESTPAQVTYTQRALYFPIVTGRLNTRVKGLYSSMNGSTVENKSEVAQSAC